MVTAAGWRKAGWGLLWCSKVGQRVVTLALSVALHTCSLYRILSMPLFYLRQSSLQQSSCLSLPRAAVTGYTTIPSSALHSCRRARPDLGLGNGEGLTWLVALVSLSRSHPDPHSTHGHPASTSPNLLVVCCARLVYFSLALPGSSFLGRGELLSGQ